MLDVVTTDNRVKTIFLTLNCGNKLFGLNDYILIGVVRRIMSLGVVADVEPNIADIRTRRLERIRRIIAASDIEYLGAFAQFSEETATIPRPAIDYLRKKVSHICLPWHPSFLPRRFRKPTVTRWPNYAASP
jgi:hypothetical protein